MVTVAAECTFEYFLGAPSPSCGWTQDGSDDFDWTRASGSTASYRTGPPFDHTYGTNKGKQSSVTTKGRLAGNFDLFKIKLLPCKMVAWLMMELEMVIFPFWQFSYKIV